jgi:soluble lytic murein transglycosylase
MQPTAFATVFATCGRNAAIRVVAGRRVTDNALMELQRTHTLQARPRPWVRATLVCAMFFVTGAHAQAGGDADIVAAKSAFDRGDVQALAAIAPRTRNHVLAPYVVYWQYELQLDSVDPATLRTFVLAWPGTPFADKLRADWLKALARRGDWARFAQDYTPQLAVDDVELACAGIQHRRLRDGDDVLREAQPLYLTGQATPDLCEPLFAALVARKSITTADRVARVRLASEAGNVRVARMLAEALPPDQRATAAALQAVERDPLRALGAGPYRWKEGGSHIVALYALERAARSDAAAARAPWVRIRRARLRQWPHRVPRGAPARARGGCVVPRR